MTWWTLDIARVSLKGQLEGEFILAVFLLYTLRKEVPYDLFPIPRLLISFIIYMALIAIVHVICLFFFFFMLHATSAWLSTFPFWIISYAILDAFNCALFELCIHKAWRMQDSMTVIDKHCSLIHPAKNDGVLHGKVCLMWMRPLCYSCAIVSAHDKALVLCWLLYLHKCSLVPMVLYSLQSVPC